jgi:hypothetical protein
MACVSSVNAADVGSMSSPSFPLLLDTVSVAAEHPARIDRLASIQAEPHDDPDG